VKLVLSTGHQTWSSFAFQIAPISWVSTKREMVDTRRRVAAVHASILMLELWLRDRSLEALDRAERLREWQQE